MSAAAAKTEAMTTEMQKLASNTDDGEPNADTVDTYKHVSTMSQMTDTADIITNNDTDNTMNNDDSAIMAKDTFDANVDKATIDDLAAAFGGNKNKTNNQEPRNDPIANNIEILK
eukprot:CAMPEP_0114659056 /NCGR_PEP_ID=MMETSP0191-20121206/16978_1 /TAXON_ID=126664 /ORGANISM="Sorites sp." /LENGTH=114 /DNA_ID=CAMNT_0001882921 /DNA_START=52 /DNA_END=397 /DNA_ORIENTATION=+